MKKNPKNKKKNGMRLWTKVVIGAAVAMLLLVVAIFIYFWIAGQSERTYFKLHANTPSVTHFTDENSINFLTSDSGRTSPEPNNQREVSSVQNFHAYYSLQSGSWSPVFKMDVTDKDANANIKIKPFIKGKWTIDSNSVSFTPERDWPANQSFKVTIDKKLYNKDIGVNSRTATFRTEKLTGTVDSFDLYPDASKKQSMVAVGVVSFNYPIDIKSFQNKVSMRLDNKNIEYSIKFDTFYRTAFITSEPIAIKDTPQKLKMNIDSAEVLNGNARASDVDASLTVESADNLFKISNIETRVVDNLRGEPEQLVLLNMTAGAKSENISDYVGVYLLPRFKDADETESHAWKQDEITEHILTESKKLDVKQIEFANPTGVYQYAFAYDVTEKDARYIYVSVKPGVMSDIGFALRNGADKIMAVPYPNQEVSIAGSGALLSLAGGRDLAIVARGGVDAAYVNLYKVKSSEINHLVSQTYNVFSGMEFRNWAFGPEDMSVVFAKKIPFADASLKKVNYSAVNLGEYLDKTNDKTGIFIVQVGASQNAADYNDKRLILLTNLGIIRKVNSDESSSVFVSNLTTGAPVGDARVSVLGRNGNPVWTGETDSVGRVNVPKLAWNEYKKDREPIAFVVTRGDDVSFIPYSAYDRQVEFSKFDVDGVYESSTNPMNAYLFSDRGIYRPGEKLNIGGIVKEKNFKSLAGIPVKLEIIDARAKVAMDKTFSLTSDGMFDAEYFITGAAPIGDWQIKLYSLTDKHKVRDMLGSASVRVEEFVPDNLKITANIIGAKTTGWLKPSDLKIDVSLRNLFGTPATDKRISAHAVLRPVQFSFPEFKGYEFTTNFRTGTGLSRNTGAALETLSQDLTDTQTDKNGHATLDIKFENNINPGTYALSVTAQGFEGNSGRSVRATSATMVSDAEYVIGYKPNGDLGYISKNAPRFVSIIAVNSDAKKTTANDLTMRIVKKETLTSLVKDYNDYYKYQTVTREKIIQSHDMDIPSNGTDIKLDTSDAGNYYMQLIDKNERVMAHVEYFIAGEQNINMKSESTAELKIKLDKSEYSAGSEIQVSVTSPYVGSGLITIEKDKVYAQRWFKTDATSSVQTITLPDGFEGTGYVNVSFVRDINSHDVFTTPYTYAVAPFAVDKTKRTIHIDLKTADIVRDKKLSVKYTVDKPSRIMIFAVNEGILQVAKYQNPNPVDYFFKKAALQVDTYQILSLLLPEYKILREFAKTGGGDYELNEMVSGNITNPFARIVNEPVAFYSGILDAKAQVPNTVTFDIPDYFNGAVRVYAVAANQNAFGSALTSAKIQSPVVISTSAPLFAVPGDEFTVNTVVSNLTENSGADARANVSAETSDNLSVKDKSSVTIDIPEMSEQLWTFKVQTGNVLGNANIDISANIMDASGKTLSLNTSRSTLSVRPEALFETNIVTGFSTSKKTNIKDFYIDMYDEMSSRELYVSTSAFVLAKPLIAYLDKYTEPCSEQTVSRAMPYALFGANEYLGIDAKTADKKITDTINILKNRQNDDGSFSLWESGSSSAYITAYVVQFLTIARENGFNIPSNMLSRGVDYLRTYSGRNIQNDTDADTHAFAIYLITRNGFVTTSYIDTFQEYANKNMKNWQSELSGAYIASAYKLLKQNDQAVELFKKYKLSESGKFVYYYDFANNVANNAVYAYLANKHFDGDISRAQFKTVLDTVQSYVASGNYSAFTSAMATMAMVGTDDTTVKNEISVTGTDGKMATELTSAKSGFTVPNNMTQLEIQCGDCDNTRGIFYALVQQGFAKKQKSVDNGIEITREYFNADGDRISNGFVGDEITVKIHVRTTGSVGGIDNVVIADLLPAGFSVIGDSISGDTDFAEAREDRVMFYTSVSKSVTTITYRAQMTAVGNFRVPAVQASSMYNPQIKGIAKSGTFKVANVTAD